MGVPQFQQTTATLPSRSYEKITQAPTTVIAAGSTEILTYYPPANTLGQLRNASITIAAPAGATAGTHVAAIGSGSGGGEFTQGTSNYGDTIVFNAGYWLSATAASTAVVPNPQPLPNNSPQSWLFEGQMQFDATSGFTTGYTNNTTAGSSASGTRSYAFGVIVEDLP